ncbi:MAG: alpha/beta fold hydrolase [Acidimicrobiia bacterium]
MSILRVGDSTVGYATDGHGEPFLLLHGTTMSRTAWDVVRPSVPGSYEWVMVEFPGSGESSMPAAALTIELLVDDALAVMNHLGHERFHVAGYSLGAVAALAIAGTAPDRVRSVTSLCGWTVSDARMRVTFDLWAKLIEADPALFIRYAFADGLTAGALTMMEPMLDDAIALSVGTIAPGSLAHLELDKTLDIAALLPKITSPTLVIGALEDRWVDIRHSRELAEVISGARLVELPAGHLVIQELAADVAALLHEHASAAA